MIDIGRKEFMKELQIKLDVFEGPLDLLLHLINQLEIDLYDIPIAKITEQYLQYLHAMQTLELEIAGEYIVMAATLMATKSKMLLPTQTVAFDDETTYEEDPREALVQQLVEYRKYKYAAEKLADKAQERSQYYTKKPMDLQDYTTEQKLDQNQINTIDLFLAFHQLLEKKKRQQVMQATIAADEFSIEEKMKEIEKQLQTKVASKGLALEDLLTVYNRSEVVVTFMALLELMKHQKIIVRQKDHFSALYLFAA